MNPHYHPYGQPELTSPHPPSPDNGNFHPGGMHHPSNGHHVLHPHHHPGGGGGGGGVPPPPGGHQPGGGGGGGDPLVGMPPSHHPAFGGGPPPGSGHLGPHHHNNNGGGGGGGGTVKVCAGCGGKIVERFLLHALDRYWHNGCLKCSCCGAMLADIGSSCFTKGGMILCKNDYMRLFGNSGACSACGQTIPASEFVMRTGGGPPGLGGGPPGVPPPGPPGQAPGQPTHVFHLKCFACSKCGAHLVPGDRYYMLAGSLVCEQDWHKLVKGSGTAAGSGTTVRKGKVGRPRRSRD